LIRQVNVTGGGTMTATKATRRLLLAIAVVTVVATIFAIAYMLEDIIGDGPVLSRK
jgi:ABC-type Zn uptake system ZnuABC Zn-binding protein ZnuA